eukprot:4223424-Lingulodinium_polyedra.AAC.1
MPRPYRPSRRPRTGTAPSGGNSGQTPWATCAMARSAGSAWRRPARACPSESLARSARRSRSGTVSRRAASHWGRRQKRCSGSSSSCAQC